MKSKFYKTGFYSLLFLGLTFGSYGQNKQEQKANQLMQDLAYWPAIEIYEQLESTGYESLELFKNLGDAYYFNADFPKANTWYDRLFLMLQDSSAHANKDVLLKVDPEYVYRYGQTLKSLGYYQKADQVLKAFTELQQTDSRAQLIPTQESYLQDIERNSQRYKIKCLTGINSPYSDFGPVVHNNALIFTSARDRGGAPKEYTPGPVRALPNCIEPNLIHWENQQLLNAFLENLKQPIISVL